MLVFVALFSEVVEPHTRGQFRNPAKECLALFRAVADNRVSGHNAVKTLVFDKGDPVAVDAGGSEGEGEGGHGGCLLGVGLGVLAFP